MHKNLLIILALALCAMITAQNERPTKEAYNFGVLPAVSYNSDLGFQYGLLTNIYDYGDGSQYPKYEHSMFAEISRYTKGSGTYRLFYDSEFLITGIRLTADVAYLPAQALHFYGFNGYDAVYNSSFENDKSSDYISRMYYKLQRNTFRFKVDLQGDIASSKLNWVLGYSFVNMDISTVPISQLNEGKDGSELLPDTALLYDNYVKWGIIGKEEANGGAYHNFKTGLVYDTRDNEACPMSGMWTELVMLNSFGSEGSFGKIGASHRQYFTLVPNDLSLAYRVGFQGTVWGDVPFYMNPYMVYSYSPSSVIDGLGGSRTVRGMVANRLVAESVAYANIEMRWKFCYFNFLNQNWYGAVAPFMDFGRTLKKIDVDTSSLSAEEKEAHFSDDAESLHATYGMGLHFSMNQNFVISADVGLPLDEQDGDMGIYIGMNWLF